MKTNQLLCPFYPRKRTCAVQLEMSALGQKRTSAMNRKTAARRSFRNSPVSWSSSLRAPRREHCKCRGPRHQHCKYDRNENKRRCISHYMTALSRIHESLNAHDCPMNHTRPHGEPNEAFMSVGISCGDEQKHAQDRIHSNDHHQIV